MFKFLPIGGVGYIGGNISYMEIDGTSFLIDTGILFPREESLGINYLYPDVEVLKGKGFKTPEFLLLTHAHEDHIGGLKHITETYPNIKIVCSTYTIMFIEKKFPNKNYNLQNVNEFSLENFSFFNIRHSIPGVYGFHYHSKKLDLGILFCTDFRFDSNEQDNDYLSSKLLERLSKLGRKRVAFIDSTNVSSSRDEGPLESDIFNSLKLDIENSDSDIFVALFPSNTFRMASIIRIANQLGKTVVPCGFSVDFSYSLGLQAGLIEPIKNKEIQKGNSIYLLSGSQGDLRGAFRRVFTGNDKKIKPQIGDKLLYSSKVIPGNEKYVGEMFNKASCLGVKINKGSNPVIHSSGHAYPKEISNVVTSFSATDVCPIHLESSFFQEFEAVSKRFKLKANIHRLENYRELTYDSNSSFKISEHEPLDLGIYLEGGERVQKGTINDRRRLGTSGSVFISINKEKSQSLKTNLYGVPDTNENELNSEISRILNSEWNNPKCEEAIRVGVRHFLSKKVGYKPMVFVHIL